VIDSLLYLDSRRIQDPSMQRLLTTMRERVYALGLVHHQLMGSRNLRTFPAAPFMTELVDNLAVFEGAAERGIETRVSVDDIHVDLDTAIPLGLIVTELVTNTFKHAGPTYIAVTLRLSAPDTAELTVVDDGGAPMQAPTNGTATLRSGGGRMILDGLVKQLGGFVEPLACQGTGTRIVVRMRPGANHGREDGPRRRG